MSSCPTILHFSERRRSLPDTCPPGTTPSRNSPVTMESGYCFWTARFRNNCSEVTNITAITIGIKTKPVFVSGTTGTTGACGTGTGGGVGKFSATAELLNTNVTTARAKAVGTVKILFTAFLNFKHVSIAIFSPVHSNIVNYSLAIWQARRLTCRQFLDQL